MYILGVYDSIAVLGTWDHTRDNYSGPYNICKPGIAWLTLNVGLTNPSHKYVGPLSGGAMVAVG